MRTPLPLRGLTGAALIHMRLYALTQSRLYNIVVTPFAWSAVAIFVLGPSARNEDVLRVLVGGGLIGIFTSVLVTSVFFIRREYEWYGTFPLLVASPTPMIAILAGYLLGESVVASSSLVVSFLTGWMIQGRLSVAVNAASIISVAFAGISMTSLALLLAPVMMLVPFLTRWFNILEYPVWIAGGLVFPISILPYWSRGISYMLSPYWAGEALRRSVQGSTIEALIVPWLATTCLCAIYILAAVMLIRVVTWHMRNTGALTEG